MSLFCAASKSGFHGFKLLVHQGDESVLVYLVAMTVQGLQRSTSLHLKVTRDSIWTFLHAKHSLNAQDCIYHHNVLYYIVGHTLLLKSVFSL